MPESDRSRDYDPFAWAYNRHWGGFAERALPLLDWLGLADLPPGAHVLDLCCGTGQLAVALTARGLKIHGVDGSPEMIAIAKKNAPEASFEVSDARSLDLQPGFALALSTFDSLNLVLALEDLEQVFRGVWGALLPAGRFIFDLNVEAGYRERWHGSFGIVEDDHALIARSSYDSVGQTGHIAITLFRLGEGWHRADFDLVQRCYPPADIVGALERAGFEAVESFDAREDLGSNEVGRMYFVAGKPEEGSG